MMSLGNYANEGCDYKSYFFCFCLFTYSTVVTVEIFRWSFVFLGKGTSVILACKIDTIIAVLQKALVVYFKIKSSTIDNFMDKCYGRQISFP